MASGIGSMVSGIAGGFGSMGSGVVVLRAKYSIWIFMQQVLKMQSIWWNQVANTVPLFHTNYKKINRIDGQLWCKSKATQGFRPTRISPQFVDEITGGPQSSAGQAAGTVNLGNAFGSLRKNGPRFDELLKQQLLTVLLNEPPLLM